MKKRIIIIASVAGIIALIAFVLVRNKKKIDENNKPVDRSQVPVSVTVTEASMMEVSGSLEVPAVLGAREEAVISAATQGKIIHLNAEPGTKVSRGQVIGNIDTRLMQINLRTTEMTGEKLEGDYRRDEELLKGNATTGKAVTESRYNYETNRLQADQIRQQIADANLVSPISGIITEKKLVAGEFVNPGTPVATVVNVSELKAQVYVNEKDVYKLTEGQEAFATSEIFPGKTFSGKVIFINPKGDATHNYLVEVLIRNEGMKLRAGTYVKVSFELGNRSDALQIPKKALVEGLKNPYVYVVKGNRSEMRKLVTGRELGENIEILEGLSAGESVITSGQINLSEGSIVEVVNLKK